VGDQAPHGVTPGSSIGQGWDKYRALVVPANAIPVQIQECRRAFYAGASEVLYSLEVLYLLLRIEAGPPGVEPTEEQLNAGAEYLERMRLELVQFLKDVADRKR
jgi:hypothetical protein